MSGDGKDIFEQVSNDAYGVLLEFFWSTFGPLLCTHMEPSRKHLGSQKIQKQAGAQIVPS